MKSSSLTDYGGQFRPVVSQQAPRKSMPASRGSPVKRGFLGRGLPNTTQTNYNPDADRLNPGIRSKSNSSQPHLSKWRKVAQISRTDFKNIFAKPELKREETDEEFKENRQREQ